LFRPGFNPTNKKRKEKFSVFWQNFLLFAGLELASKLDVAYTPMKMQVKAPNHRTNQYFFNTKSKLSTGIEVLIVC
jgi:hypothetical protein